MTSNDAQSVSSVLDERGKRYGTFKGHARVTQRLKKLIFTHCRDDGELVEAKLTPSQKESLEMICHKIGRIVNGDPNYADSWIDIAGYAQLVADELNGKVR